MQNCKRKFTPAAITKARPKGPLVSNKRGGCSDDE
jgi:hypothetical protein